MIYLALERGLLTEQEVPPEIPVGLPSKLLVRRPDLVQAEQLFYAETARIGVAQAMRFPSFSLTGALGLASTDLSTLISGESLFYNVGGSMLGPIINWGKNKRSLETSAGILCLSLQVHGRGMDCASRSRIALSMIL